MNNLNSSDVESLTLVVEASLGGIAFGLFDANVAQGHTPFIFKKIQAGKGVLAGNLGQHLDLEMHSHGFALHQIKNMVVSVGPGSFTGIRIGLSWALGCVSSASESMLLKGYSSLEQIWANLDVIGPKLLFIPNTKSHGIWVNAEGVVSIDPYEDISRYITDNLPDRIHGYTGMMDVVPDILRATLEKKQAAVVSLNHQNLLNRSLEALKEAFLSQRASLKLEPLYLRLSSAQERLQKN